MANMHISFVYDAGNQCIFNQIATIMEDKVFDLYASYLSKQDLKALQAFINDAVAEGYKTFNLEIFHDLEEALSLDEIELVLHA